MTTANPRWLDQDEQRAWRAYLALTTALEAQLNRELLQDSGVSMADYAVLVALSEADGLALRAGELARHLGWEKSRLSHHVGRMRGRGLVRRTDCEQDRRSAWVTLTDTGAATLDRAVPVHVAGVRRHLIDRLDRAGLRQLAEFAEAAAARLTAVRVAEDTPADGCPGEPPVGT